MSAPINVPENWSMPDDWQEVTRYQMNERITVMQPCQLMIGRGNIEYVLRREPDEEFAAKIDDRFFIKPV